MNHKNMYTTILSKDTVKPFIDFINKVEQIVFNNLDMYLLELPKEDYYGFFAKGCTPEQVAEIVINGNMIN